MCGWLTDRTDSIFYDDQSGILFGTYKYIGSDYKADMKKMSEIPHIRDWWDITDRMQVRTPPSPPSLRLPQTKGCYRRAQSWELSTARRVRVGGRI